MIYTDHWHLSLHLSQTPHLYLDTAQLLPALNNPANSASVAQHAAAMNQNQSAELQQRSALGV